LEFIIILILIFINAFFVAAEMALARVRRTRIDQLAEQKSLAAKMVQKHLDDPDRYISACQLGITLATLLLGAVGEARLADDLTNTVMGFGISQAWSHEILNYSRMTCFFGAFAVTAYVQTVLGELIPKTWTFQRAEQVILSVIYPMEMWCVFAAPFINLLNGTTELILNLLKVEEPPRRHFVHTEEELKMLVSASHDEGVLQPEEEEMLHSVFDFSDTVASEIMTPRTDMVCVAASTTVREFVELTLEHGHSRLPIYEKDLDDIFGLVHIRDAIRAMLEHKETVAIRELSRLVHIVPENKGLGDLLTEFKKNKTHMAIVVDEYGGVRGMVTMEDLLEELVGDITDEHDEEDELIKVDTDGSVLLDGKIPLEEANEKLGLQIDDELFNTLGGHVFGMLGHEPQAGDEVNTDDYTLRIEESDRHRIIKLRLIRHPLRDGKDGNGTITLAQKTTQAKSLEAS
jgi:CBS domain containing-hemolysin-like protein